jgi:hypothetical protein
LLPIARLDKRSSGKLKLMGDAQGGKALLLGEPLLLRRGENHPAPAFPGETGKGIRFLAAAGSCFISPISHPALSDSGTNTSFDLL